MTQRVPAIVLLLSALSSAAHAQSSVWIITPFGAAAFGADMTEVVPGAGVAVERDWIPHVDVEAEVCYLPVFTRSDFGIRTSVVTAGIGALPHVTVARHMVAYAELGAAAVRFDARRVAGVSQAADVEAAITSGAGLRVRLGARARLGADVRFVHVNNAPNFWRAYAGIGLIVRR